MRHVSGLLLGLIILWPAAFAHAAFDPFAGPKPIAIFIAQNPWLMVIGSDTPRVAIYENGDAIFAKKVGESYSYHVATLSTDELAALEEAWLPLLSMHDLKKSYELSWATDQTTSMFYLRHGEQSVAVSAYGLDCQRRPPARSAEVLPALLSQVHRKFCALTFEQSREWVPQYIEVMLWDYSYAPSESIEWPKAWPSISSERAIKRGEAYSIFLDGSELQNLQEFLATQKEKGAIVLEGKKWAVSYRFTFPNEPVWRNALFGD
jgi:hypothetical protein